MIKSKQIKHALLRYYRFKRGCVVGTEVWIHGGIADILAVSDDLKKSYEVEVKISISDLRADFKKHKQKSNYHKNKANYFYFCFPKNLLEKALPIIEAQNVKYGIITYDDRENLSLNVVPEAKLSVYKRARKLHNNTNDILYKTVVKRVVSELIKMYDKLETSKLN